MVLKGGSRPRKHDGRSRKLDDHLFTLSPTYKKLRNNLNSPLAKYLLHEDPTSKIPQCLQTVSAGSTWSYWGILVTQSFSIPYKQGFLLPYLLFLSFFHVLFWDRVSYSTGWIWFPSMVKDDLSQPLKCRVYTPSFVCFCGSNSRLHVSQASTESSRLHPNSLFESLCL